MNEILINGLAMIGAVTCLTWLTKGIKGRMAKLETQPDAATGPAQACVTVIPVNNDIAVIAAAVYALLGAARIVHIEDPNFGHRWAADGRWMHQNSHRPH